MLVLLQASPGPNPKGLTQILSTKGGAVWIPALSAIGAGFAIGLAAIGSGVGQATVLLLVDCGVKTAPQTSTQNPKHSESLNPKSPKP